MRVRRARPRPVFSKANPAPRIPYGPIALRMVAVGLLIAGGIFGPALLQGRVKLTAPPMPHLPDLSVIAAAPPVIQAHLGAILGSIAVGAALMAGVKGARLHRYLGWTWSVFMLMAATASMFIPTSVGFHIGRFGPLHVFSVAVLILVPLAIASARGGKYLRHGRVMTNVFLGGVVIAGAFAFAPGRLMWDVFFG